MKKIQCLESDGVRGTGKRRVSGVSSGETQLRCSFPVSHYPRVREQQILDIGSLTKKERGLLCFCGGGKSHRHLSRGRNDHSNRNPLDR